MGQPSFSDEELAILGAHGDRDAIDELVRRFSKLVRDQLRRHLIGWLWMDAELIDDAAQDAFLALTRALDRFDPNKGTFEAFVTGICGNIARMESRKMTARYKFQSLDRLLETQDEN